MKPIESLNSDEELNWVLKRKSIFILTVSEEWDKLISNAKLFHFAMIL